MNDLVVVPRAPQPVRDDLARLDLAVYGTVPGDVVGALVGTTVGETAARSRGKSHVLQRH